MPFVTKSHHPLLDAVPSLLAPSHPPNHPIPDSLQHDVLLLLGRALVRAELPLPPLDVLLILLLRLRQVDLVLGGLSRGDFLLKGSLPRVVCLHLEEEEERDIERPDWVEVMSDA